MPYVITGCFANRRITRVIPKDGGDYSTLDDQAGVIMVLFLIIKNGINHGPFFERTLPYQLSVNWISEFEGAILNRT